MKCKVKIMKGTSKDWLGWCRQWLILPCLKIWHARFAQGALFAEIDEWLISWFCLTSAISASSLLHFWKHQQNTKAKTTITMYFHTMAGLAMQFGKQIAHVLKHKITQFLFTYVNRKVYSGTGHLWCTVGLLECHSHKEHMILSLCRTVRWNSEFFKPVLELLRPFDMLYVVHNKPFIQAQYRTNC